MTATEQRLSDALDLALRERDAARAVAIETMRDALSVYLNDVPAAVAGESFDTVTEEVLMSRLRSIEKIVKNFS